jgi:uncharacterized membrane protein YhhN
VLAVVLLLLSRPLGIPGVVPKMTASTGFLLMAWAAGAFNSRYGIAVFIGLFFSWWGDLFLALPGTFLFGLVAFLIGHIAYSVAFLLWGVRWSGVGAGFAVLALPAVGLFFWLNPHLSDDMRGPVYAYMVVITSMVALSVGAWRNGGTPIMVVAALMFWLSDICVARQQFVEDSMWNPALGLPLYFGGQMVFAYSIKIANRIRANA